MKQDQLNHKLAELKSVYHAEVIWREQTRAQLLNQISNSASRPFSLNEKFIYRVQQMRLVFAPMHLAPVLAAALIMIVGYSPFTSALAASLPGQTLYPLKRVTEKFELSLRSSSDSQGIFYLTLANRRLEEAAAIPATNTQVQADLLRDYNITLGFAQASLETGLPSKSLAQAYDQATDVLAMHLNGLPVASANRQVYFSAQDLTSKVSSRALALLVSAHSSEKNGVMPADVANRLTAEIAKVEAKLEGVDVKIKEFPSVKPAPKVIIVSKATVVPVSEASRQAKESLVQAKELIAKNEFTLALEKVQESEDITAKSEAAVTDEEVTAEEAVPAESTESGEVKGDSTDAVTPATDTTPTSEVPIPTVGDTITNQQP